MRKPCELCDKPAVWWWDNPLADVYRCKDHIPTDAFGLIKTWDELTERWCFKWEVPTGSRDAVIGSLAE